MTLIAGCFCLDNESQVPTELKTALKTNLRRRNDSRGQTYSVDLGSFFLVKWDSGAFDEPAWLDIPDGTVSTLVGDPLFSASIDRLSRIKQLKQLDLFQSDIADKLAATRGSFSIVTHSSKLGCLKIATDAIGIRSVYYLVQDGVFVFASALRILENTAAIRKRISVIGVAEQCIYGQPLGSKSPYDEISILREAELITVSKSGIAILQYYDWSRADFSPQSEEKAAELLYSSFIDGVRLRALPNERALAFLSGGMDSRAIVAALMSCGHSVSALNFSPDGSQDQGYANQFAEAAKAAGADCQIFSLPRDEDPNFSLLAYKAKLSLNETSGINVQRPEIIWSGDGGSVGLGHVYMDEYMINLCENENIVKVARYFTTLHRHYLPVRALAASWRKTLPATIFQDVVAELERYPRRDVGRQIYLFLLMNDQRRHLFKHFETIDEHGLEFLTPFFDSAFLRAIASTPIRWGILHRLYAIWFTHLPKYAQSTPWQTYIGHVKCPVPVSDNLSYQWTAQPRFSSETTNERIRLACQLINTLKKTNPEKVFSRTRILASAILHAIGVRDGRFTLQTIDKFQRY